METGHTPCRASQDSHPYRALVPLGALTRTVANEYDGADMALPPTSRFFVLLLTIAAAVPVVRESPWRQEPGRGTEPPKSALEKVDFGLERPLPRTEGAIRIATYNVENLFDHEDDPELSGEWDDLGRAITDARARELARVIRAVDADIIALQEIESLDALRWFRDTYLPEAGYDFLASIDAGYYRGIENAVMSRYEIVSATVQPRTPIDDVVRQGLGWEPVPENTTQPMFVQRSPIRVDIRVNDEYRLTVFSIHHKSGRDFNWKREAEAIRNLERIARAGAADESRNIIIMGDFNAAPWDKSFRLYLEAGFVDIHAHRTVKGEEGRIYKTHRSDRVLDYVLMNAAALHEFVIGSAHIVGTYNPPSSWDWRTDPYPPGYASDHYPVVIDLIPQDRK